MKYIRQDNSNAKAIKYIYEREGEQSIMLSKGKEAFLKCVEVLQRKEKIRHISFKKELNIHIPDDKELWADRGYIERQCNDKRQEFPSMDESAFHFDIGSSNPEVSLILQLVDDSSFKGSRRENLLNNDYKFIGISNFTQGNISCSYFFLSGDIE